MLPVAVARSLSDVSAKRYVLPVLWTTSCVHIMEPVGLNQRGRVCSVEFARWRQRNSRTSDNVIFGRVLQVAASGAKLLSTTAGLLALSFDEIEILAA